MGKLPGATIYYYSTQTGKLPKAAIKSYSEANNDQRLLEPIHRQESEPKA